ncbi:hypothetical protein CGK13_22965 [Vibrio parahaemolyticus]|nr:hypothetical protein CGK13_22965 [Vibrio parahaemolyticus]
MNEKYWLVILIISGVLTLLFGVLSNRDSPEMIAYKQRMKENAIFIKDKPHLEVSREEPPKVNHSTKGLFIVFLVFFIISIFNI